MKYSTPICLTLSMLASSAQADPAIIVDVQQRAAPDNIMNPGLSFETFIIGGSDAGENDFPYFVSFGNCGGTLIAPDAVLFAAHCKDAEGKQVLINSHRWGTDDSDTEVRFCENWVEHDDYCGSPLECNDFALCKLDTPVYIDSNIKLEWNDGKDPDFDLSGDLIVMGYGETGSGMSPTLKHATIQAYGNEHCKDIYKGFFDMDSMMCAGVDDGRRDSCQGDSGGPLVKRKKQGSTITDTIVGISSFGSNCGVAGMPGVYADVRSSKDWIGLTVCEDFGSVADWCVCDDEEWCNDEQQALEDNTCDPNTEVAFEFEVNTDEYATETSWKLQERKHGTQKISSAAYIAKNHKNVSTICLKKEMCYKFIIWDSYGDGLCAIQNDCKSYSFGLPGPENKRYFEFTDQFDKMKTNFCINDVGEPTNKWPPKNPNRTRKQNRKNKNNNKNLRR